MRTPRIDKIAYHSSIDETWKSACCRYDTEFQTISGWGNTGDSENSWILKGKGLKKTHQNQMIP